MGAGKFNPEHGRLIEPNISRLDSYSKSCLVQCCGRSGFAGRLALKNTGFAATSATAGTNRGRITAQSFKLEERLYAAMFGDREHRHWRRGFLVRRLGSPKHLS